MTSILELKKQFDEMVRGHDVTFEYSDDGSVWRRGQAQRDAIKALAKELPAEYVAEVWNKRMDEMFTAEEAPRWYWR